MTSKKNQTNLCYCRLIVINAVICLTAFIPIKVHPENVSTECMYHYVNVNHPRLLISINDDRTSIAFGGRVIPAKKCNYGDESVCIISEGFLFTIPPSIEVGHQYKYGDFSYNILANQKYKILGSVIDLNVFELIGKDFNLIFWYSSKYGLVSIQANSERNPSVYMSNRKYAYGSKQCDE